MFWFSSLLLTLLTLLQTVARRRCPPEGFIVFGWFLEIITNHLKYQNTNLIHWHSVGVLKKKSSLVSTRLGEEDAKILEEITREENIVRATLENGS